MSNDEDSTVSANRSLAIAAGVLAVVVGCVVYRWNHPSTTFAADGLDTYWDAAVDRSHETHTPTLVLFTADWCPGCRQMHSDVLSRSDIQDEITMHYTMTTVDLTNPTPAARERSSRYGVSAIPTLIRFNAEGKETGRTHNVGPEKMLAWLREGE